MQSTKFKLVWPSERLVRKEKRKISVVSVEMFVKIIKNQSFGVVAQGGCVGEEEYLKVGDYCSIFESQL